MSLFSHDCDVTSRASLSPREGDACALCFSDNLDGGGEGEGQWGRYFRDTLLFCPAGVVISKQMVVVNADSPVKRNCHLAVSSSILLNLGEWGDRGVLVPMKTLF